jgi:predicted HTH transcriptional regulator
MPETKPTFSRSRLFKWVTEGEGQRLEFKLKANHPDKITKGIAAFANTQGGFLLLGVDDHRQLKGCKNADEEEFVMLKAIHDFLQPAPTVHIHRVTVAEEREVIAFEVLEHTDKPVYWKDPLDKTGSEAKGRVYVRVADQSLQASAEMRQILKVRSKPNARRLHYGEKEKILMTYLDKNPHITLNEFMTLAGLSKKVASDTLVFLCVLHVLDILPGEQEDRFYRVAEDSDWQ